MLDRTSVGAFFRGPGRDRKTSRDRAACRPLFEGLEERKLLVASIGSIPNVTVPQSLGYQVSVNGTGSNAPTQTYAATSTNPDIKVTVAQGPYVTFNVSHTPAANQPTDPAINNEPITLQLFQDLTPKTTSRINTFVTNGYYNNKFIARIAGNFDAQPTGFVIQGGYFTPDGTDPGSGVPPIGLELNQQLAYVQPFSLAMARTSDPNSNDAEFFITTGTPTSLDFQYTLFGQAVSGFSTIQKLTQVATTTGVIPGEKSKPISPVQINTATSSTTNPNGVIHVDATGAVAGETATVRVTAFDPSTNTSAEQTFQVQVGPDTTNHPASFTFKPLAFPVAQAVPGGTATAVQLKGTTQNPNNTAVKVGYALASQPTHGTITNFNATTGTLTYTPAAGFMGTDNFTYGVTNTGGSPSPLAGNTQTVTLNVGAVPPVNTGTVRVIGNVLTVTPRPRTDKGVNTIRVSEAPDPASPTTKRIEVFINGVFDATMPAVKDIQRVVVYGAKASDNIAIDKTLDPPIRVTIDGGLGGRNSLLAGPGPTRAHGWFGQNTLIGGTGHNQLIGQAGHVKFRPSATTDFMFAGVLATPNGQKSGGQYFKSVNGHAVPSGTPAFYRGRAIPAQS